MHVQLNGLYNIENIRIVCNTLIADKLYFILDLILIPTTYILLLIVFIFLCQTTHFFIAYCTIVLVIQIKRMFDKKIKLYTLISLIITGLNTKNTIILNMQKYALSSIYAKTCKI